MKIACGTCKHYDPDDSICRKTGEREEEKSDCHALNKDENLLWEKKDGEQG